MRYATRRYALLGFTISLLAGQAGFCGEDDMPGWEVPKQSSETIVIPVSEEELMNKVKQAFSAAGGEPFSIKKVVLDEYGTVFITRGVKTGVPLFVRFVARRVPCGDCHDVFFLYTFDGVQFIKFIPVLVSKRYNKKWDLQDIEKVESRFAGNSIKERVSFNPFVDTITSATMSSKIVFHSMNETKKVYGKLTEMGYVEKIK
jgi:hypothetical protein